MADQTQETLDQYGLTLHDLSDEMVSIEYSGERFSFPRRHLAPALQGGKLPPRVKKFMEDTDAAADVRETRVSERQARVDEARLPERTLDHLDKHGVAVDRLREMSDDEILAIPGIGQASLAQIREHYPQNPPPTANDPLRTEEERRAFEEREAKIDQAAAGEDVVVPSEEAARAQAAGEAGEAPE